MKKGWQIKTLGDVFAFDKVQGVHRGLPYVGLEHIESHTARFIGSSEAQHVKSSTFRFSVEHVLYGRLRPYLKKALAAASLSKQHFRCRCRSWKTRRNWPAIFKFSEISL